MTGIDLNQYKRQQMERRLAAFRAQLGYPTFSAFLEALKRDRALLAKTIDQMTINVSEFFRNPDRWQALLRHMEKSPERQWKIWSAGCASGEEPYTIAMLMEEHGYFSYRIWATDIDLAVLGAARLGKYHERQLVNVPRPYLDKYFSYEQGAWWVSERLKRHVYFERHDLLRDSYPTGFDLIVCRNVLIYFTDAAKQHVLRSFSKALRPGGWLFVGSTEQFLTSQAHQFKIVIPFLYRKIEDAEVPK